MITAGELIKKAESYLGTKDNGNNKVKFNTEFYGKEVQGDGYPWCVVFIWYLFKKLNALKLFCSGERVASCGVVMSEMKSRKLSYTAKPEKGDLVIFDFSGRHTAHTHIGIVTEVINSNTFKTIEGNTSNTNYTNGGYVLRQTRYISQVNCFIRPEYSAEKAKAVELKENGTVYKYPFKDIAGKSSPGVKSLKKGDKVELIDGSDDGWGWSQVKSGSSKGFIMNRHLKAKGLSPFKTYTAEKEICAQPVVNKKLGAAVKLKKGTVYTLICEIESGVYKGRKYISADKKKYYI